MHPPWFWLISVFLPRLDFVIFGILCWHWVLRNQMNVGLTFGMQVALIRTLISWRAAAAETFVHPFMHVCIYLFSDSNWVTSNYTDTCGNLYLHIKKKLIWEPLLTWGDKNKLNYCKALYVINACRVSFKCDACYDEKIHYWTLLKLLDVFNL